MARSQRLRLSEVRAVYRLVGECRDLGDDSVAWQRHLLAEAARLVRCRIGIGGFEQGLRSRPEVFRPIDAVDVGWDSDADRRLWLQFVCANQRRTDAVFRLGCPRDLPLVQTHNREQIVGDRVWYASAFFNDYMRKARMDLGILSWHILDRSVTHAISVHQALGENKLTERECRLIGLLHQEIGPLIGRALAGPGPPGRSGLSARLREALDCLLDGDSEKQAARRMGVSPYTLHEYVKAIYVHFGVSSRAELLASFLRWFRGRGQDA